MLPLVTIETAMAYLGLPTSGSPLQADVQRLLDDISGRIRKRTRRDFEGAATTYDEVLRLDRRREILLPHVPVAAVIAVRQTFFDNTEMPIQTPFDVVGQAGTTLAAAALDGAVNLKLTSVAGLAVGDEIRVGSGSTMETVYLTSVGTAGAGGTGVNITPGLRYAQLLTAPVYEVVGSPYWRLEDAERGKLVLAYSFDYARVTWRTTGEVDATIAQAALDWLKDCWDSKASPRVKSRQIGDWSETLAVGPAPAAVQSVITSYWRSSAPGRI